MSRTDRRKAWGRCPETDCAACVQGKAKLSFRRRARHLIRAAIRCDLERL